MINHRSRAFESMFARIEAGLRDVFLTARPVYVGTTSATGFMEMAIRNAPDGAILSLVNGGFSQRFAEIAEACGRQVQRVSVPWGQTHDLDALDQALASGKFAAVTVAHSETSTGVLSDVRAIAPIAHAHGAIIMVDSVSGAGGAKLTVDEWGLDFALTGSQKAMALPPGLAFAVASADYIERAKTAAGRGTYFDIVQYDKNAATNETPSTPAVSLFFALEAQLEDIGREGVEMRWERHLQMRDATIEWVQGMRERRGVNLGILAPEGARSPTVSVITLPAGMASKEVREAILARGYTVGSGYGKLGETTFRIGHMGDHTLDGLTRCLHACEAAITELAERKRLVRV
jgi:aspartate aminotransferase-like enzyme